MIIKRQCCKCKKLLGFKLSYRLFPIYDGISHGYCNKCGEKMKLEIKQLMEERCVKSKESL